MSQINNKNQFIYGLFSTAIVGTCFTFFLFCMNILAFYLPLGVDNSYFRNKSPYQICHNLDAKDYEKPTTINVEECIKILTKQDLEYGEQTRKTNLAGSCLGFAIFFILGFCSYKVAKNLSNDF